MGRFTLDGVIQPDGFAIAASPGLSEAELLEPGSWTGTRLPVPLAWQAGVGRVVFEVLAPLDEEVM